MGPRHDSLKHKKMSLIKWFKSLFGKNETKPQKEVSTGSLKFYNRSKGYGFIYTKETSKKIFVHVSDMKDRLKVGDQVQFEVEKSPKGFRARNVERL